MEWKRVLLEEEVEQVMYLFHYSEEKGCHCGRDAMLDKISMYK